MFGKNSRRRPANSKTAPVYSYYQQKRPDNKLKSKPARNPSQSKRSWHMIPTFLAAFACVATLVYSLYVSPNIVLKTSGTAFYRDKQTYVNEINQMLSGSVLNKSKLTLNSSALEQQILKKYPEVASVTVALPLVGRTPIVGITFAAPAMRFVSVGQQLILDTSGKVLPISNLDVTLPMVTDDSGIAYKVGERALTSEEVEAITTVYDEILAHERKVANIKIGTAPKEAQLQIEGENYFIKFKLDKTAREQVGALWASLDKLASEGKKPATYIDVRLSERVFVL